MQAIVDSILLSEVQLKLGIGKHLILLANVIANDEQRSSLRGAWPSHRDPRCAAAHRQLFVGSCMTYAGGNVVEFSTDQHNAFARAQALFNEAKGRTNGGAALTPRLFRLSPNMLLAEPPAAALLASPQSPQDSAEARSLEAERALLAELEAEALVRAATSRRRRNSKQRDAGAASSGERRAETEAAPSAQDDPCLVSETADGPVLRQKQHLGRACMQALHTDPSLGTTRDVGPLSSDRRCRSAERFAINNALESPPYAQEPALAPQPLLPLGDPSADPTSALAEVHGVDQRWEKRKKPNKKTGKNAVSQPTKSGGLGGVGRAESCEGAAAVTTLRKTSPSPQLVEASEMRSRIQRAIEARHLLIATLLH